MWNKPKDDLEQQYTILKEEIKIMQDEKREVMSDRMGLALMNIIDYIGFTRDKKHRRWCDYLHWEDIRSHTIYYMVRDLTLYTRKIDLSDANWRRHITNNINYGFLKTMIPLRKTKRDYSYNYSPKDLYWINSLIERGLIVEPDDEDDGEKVNIEHGKR